MTYHHLGMIAQEQRDFAQAEQWYRKSLAISEKPGNESDAASTYHQLGSIAQEQRDFAQAEQWYHKSLAISEKLGNEYDAASTYHQLGSIAQEQRDFAQAEQWYHKSLAIKEKLGNGHGAARTYHHLGSIAQAQRDFAQAGQWYMRSIVIFLRYNDRYSLSITAQSFLRCYAQAPPAVQATLKALWENAGLGPLPDRERTGVSRMTTLLHRIETLSDADAQRILTTFARNQPGYSDSTLSPELTAALRYGAGPHGNRCQYW